MVEPCSKIVSHSWIPYFIFISVFKMLFLFHFVEAGGRSERIPESAHQDTEAINWRTGIKNTLFSFPTILVAHSC